MYVYVYALTCKCRRKCESVKVYIGVNICVYSMHAYIYVTLKQVKCHLMLMSEIITAL